MEMEIRSMKRFEIARSGRISESSVFAEQNDSGYFYFNLGGGGFNTPKKIWVNRKAIDRVENKNVVIDKLDYRITEEGNIVLMPGEKDIIVLFAECGYRGGSKIETTANVIASNYYYHSQRGSLGVSIEILCEVEPGDRFTVKRGGRLYGAPRVINLEYRGGKLIEIPGEGEDIRDLL